MVAMRSIRGPPRRGTGALTRAAAALLTIMFVVTPLVAVAGEGQTGGSHILLVDTDSAYERSWLDRSGATVLEDYGGFAMVEATEGQMSHLTVRRVLDDRAVIGIAGYSFDTRDGVPALPRGLRSSPPDVGSAHFLIQFHGPIKQEWKDALSLMGASLTNYIPDFAFIARMDVTMVDAVRALPFVSWVGYYQPAFKMDPEVLTWRGMPRLDIALHEGEATTPVIEAITRAGGIISIDSWQQINPTIEALVPAEAVATLARMEQVWWMEVHRVGGLPPNDPAQWILQSNTQNYHPLYDHGIHGENMTIGNADTGIHVAHLAFHDANRAVQYTDPASNTAPDTQHRKIVNYWTFGDNTDQYAGGHGTRTAGVNAGDNDANNGNPQYHGMGYKAKISFQDVWDDQTGQDARPADKGQMYDKTWRDGGWIHSGSLVCWAGGEYNTEAMELDQFLWNHKDFLGVIANHNYGSGDVPNSVCDLASAKNTMSIGAAENTPNQASLHDYTGRGPTDDGRLKPTVSSVTDVNAPADNTQNGFADIGGTSGATPSAAGIMVLARQYFYDGFYPSGESTPTSGFNASGALLKAVAVNGAEEMDGSNAYQVPYNGMDYPSNTQGWGRINLDNALYFSGDMRSLKIDDNRTGLSTGQNSTHTIDVVGSDMPLEVTLVWTDYWGQPNAAKELVNDLDLEVTAPDGTTVFKGNVLGGTSNPHHSQTGGAFDDVNVEENFINISPTKGKWTVKVTATNTPQGPQEFALVMTGNFSKLDDLALTKKDVLVSLVEPDEGDQVNFNLTIRNLGGADLEDVKAVITLDGSPFDTRLVDIVAGVAIYDIDWTAEWGDHTFEFEVDPDDEIEELSEANNKAMAKIYVNKLPIADFTVTPIDVLTFQNISVDATASTDDGNVTKYRFRWGDGKMTNWQTEPTAIHDYPANGEYNVSVMVMDNRSKESQWAENVTITVNNRGPAVIVTASTYEVLTFENISFDGSKSFDMDGAIEYLWDFDDGVVNRTSDTPLHMYTDDGYYNVTFTVTDDDDASNSTTLEIHVMNRRPTATFKSTAKEGNATTQFNFVPTIFDMDGEVVDFEWDFGDGATSSDPAPFHNYGDDGTYNVTLVVVDDDGARSDVHSMAIRIYNLAPIANFTVNLTEALTYEYIEFTSISEDIDGDIVSLLWNMGDGMFYFDEDVVQHRYKDNDNYKVSLKVTDDDDAISEYNFTVRILNRAPVLVVEFNESIVAGTSVIFSANGSEDIDGTIISYEWDFGNDTVKREPVVNFTWWRAGTYYVNFTLMDNDRAKTTTTITLTVVPPPPPPPPPDDDGQGLSLLAVWAILGLVIAMAAIVMAIMIIKARRKRASEVKEGEGPPAGFDPNAPATIEGVSAYEPPVPQEYAYGTEGYGDVGYQQTGHEEQTGYDTGYDAGAGTAEEAAPEGPAPGPEAGPTEEAGTQEGPAPPSMDENEPVSAMATAVEQPKDGTDPS